MTHERTSDVSTTAASLTKISFAFGQNV